MSRLYHEYDTFGMRGYKDASAANPWGSGNIKRIDIPNVDSKTKEEAEAWIIKNYLVKDLNNLASLLNEEYANVLRTMATTNKERMISNNVTVKNTANKQEVENTTPVVSKEEWLRTVEQPMEEKKTFVQEKPKRRFRVGEHYSIFPSKNKKLKREYEVKKTIYTIEGREVRILIMKQIKGDYHTKYCLNRKDCLIYHIKYEEGLEVFSMDLDWKLLNKKEKSYEN